MIGGKSAAVSSRGEGPWRSFDSRHGREPWALPRLRSAFVPSEAKPSRGTRGPSFGLPLVSVPRPPAATRDGRGWRGAEAPESSGPHTCGVRHSLRRPQLPLWCPPRSQDPPPSRARDRSSQLTGKHAPPAHEQEPLVPVLRAGGAKSYRPQTAYRRRRRLLLRRLRRWPPRAMRALEMSPCLSTK